MAKGIYTDLKIGDRPYLFVFRVNAFIFKKGCQLSTEWVSWLFTLVRVQSLLIQDVTTQQITRYPHFNSAEILACHTHLLCSWSKVLCWATTCLTEDHNKDIKWSILSETRSAQSTSKENLKGQHGNFVHCAPQAIMRKRAANYYCYR